METSRLEDGQLLERLNTLVRQERENTADVVAHLAEVDRRQLAEKLGYPSLFEYCVQKLGYPPASAYHRVRAAKAIQKKPGMLDHLKGGQLSLRTIVLLHPYLQEDKADELVRQACGKSQREVEAMLAPLCPKQGLRDSVRVILIESAACEGLPLFEKDCLPEAARPAQRKLQVTFIADESFADLLERARRLLWHKYPDGRMEGIFAEALGDLLEKRDPASWSSSRAGTSSGRNIPRWIRREVWKRDGGRCVYASTDGRICGSRKGLEFDHAVPWSMGGSSNDPTNVRLLCRNHNQLAAREAGLDRPAGDIPPIGGMTSP